MRRYIVTLLLLLGLASPAFAQNGTVMPNPKFTGFDNNGLIMASGRLCTYAAGTTTPQATYSDVGLTSQNTNPIILDAAGRATVFLSSTSYKFVLRAASSTAITGVTSVDCAASAQIWSQDNIGAIPTTSAGVDVLCTAGEALTAGQAVYWSDGSGSKNAGQCYKADSTNAYSSTLNWVGMVPNNISSGAIGSVRMAGSITGLAGLTIGLPYYLSTAGTVTATAPVNARKIGQADSATSLIVFPRESPIPPFVDDFRLSLTTATCVTTADVTAAGTLFLTPCTGNRITLFDTTGKSETCTTNEISIAVPALTSQMYDVWAYDSTFGTCTVTLELLAWTNDTTRATAVTKTSGSNWRWTKSGDTSRMFLGSMRTTTVANQTESSATKRFVANYYNRVRLPLIQSDTTVNWAYSTATWRQQRATTTNQVEVVQAMAESPIYLVTRANVGNDTGAATTIATLGIGEDSTTTPVNAQSVGALSMPTANVFQLVIASLEKVPAVGYHKYVTLEAATAAGTTTWVGASSSTAAASTSVGTGITGWIEN